GVVGYGGSPNLLDVVGIKVALGRNFRPEEDRPGNNHVVILTHGLWQSRFGGDPNVVGRTVTVNGVARTVIGVLPPNVNYPQGAGMLAPLGMNPETMSNRHYHDSAAVGRVQAGVSGEQGRS